MLEIAGAIRVSGVMRIALASLVPGVPGVLVGYPADLRNRAGNCDSVATGAKLEVMAPGNLKLFETLGVSVVAPLKPMSGEHRCVLGRACVPVSDSFGPSRQAGTPVLSQAC